MSLPKIIKTHPNCIPGGLTGMVRFRNWYDTGSSPLCLTSQINVTILQNGISSVNVNICSHNDGIMGQVDEVKQ